MFPSITSQQCTAAMREAAALIRSEPQPVGYERFALNTTRQNTGIEPFIQLHPMTSDPATRLTYETSALPSGGTLMRHVAIPDLLPRKANTWRVLTPGVLQGLIGFMPEMLDIAAEALGRTRLPIISVNNVRNEGIKPVENTHQINALAKCLPGTGRQERLYARSINIHLDPDTLQGLASLGPCHSLPGRFVLRYTIVENI